MEDVSWLIKIMETNGFPIGQSGAQLLDSYVRKLLQWNKKINLISRQTEKAIWSQHILASISFLFKLEISNNSSMVDIGTGGGLPGIPLAILNPECRFTLIDSIHKKTRALKNIVDELSLSNVNVVCGRAEELAGEKDLRQQFTYTIARAVAPMADIVRWSKPFLATFREHPVRQEKRNAGRTIIERGSVLMLKGGDLRSEIEETRIRHEPHSVQTHQLEIIGIDPSEVFDKKIIIIKP